MKIYLAGGWFSPQQEEEHTRIYNLLKKNCFKVFNPRLESPQKNLKDIGSNILAANLKGIQNCDVVVCITDYKDMGTLWESGYAYANKKVVVYYAETLGNHGFNLMLAKTGYVTQTENQLIQRLNQLIVECKFRDIYEDYKGELE